MTEAKKNGQGMLAFCTLAAAVIGCFNTCVWTLTENILKNKCCLCGFLCWPCFIAIYAFAAAIVALTG